MDLFVLPASIGTLVLICQEEIMSNGHYCADDLFIFGMFFIVSA